MKTGAGEDPFATDPGEVAEDVDEVPDEQEPRSVEASPEEQEESSAREGTSELPWAIRRDGPKDERPEVIQLFVQEGMRDREKDFRRDVERELGNDVFKTDLREAAYLVAMNHPDEVAETLREWGCEHL